MKNVNKIRRSVEYWWKVSQLWETYVFEKEIEKWWKLNRQDWRVLVKWKSDNDEHYYDEITTRKIEYWLHEKVKMMNILWK